MEPEAFNCSDCKLGRHCDEGGIVAGSRGAAPILNKFEIEEINYVSNVCPKPSVDNDAFYYLKLYKHYKNSVFPFVGGLLNQPSYYLDYMEIIDSAH